MDTSKEYIKMCDCPEIQNLKSLEQGNWFQKTYDDESWIVCQGQYTDSVHIGDFKDEDYKITWLPRQDQLQDFLELDSYKWFRMCWNFVEGEPLPVSSETIALEIYMREKHNKNWDGKKWT